MNGNSVLHYSDGNLQFYFLWNNFLLYSLPAPKQSILSVSSVMNSIIALRFGTEAKFYV